MKPYLILALMPAASLAGPYVNMQTGDCEVFVGEVQYSLQNCKTTAQSGAFTSFTDHILDEEIEEEITLSVNSEDYPDVPCVGVDLAGVEYESFSWEANLYLEPYRKDESKTRAIYELYCHRESVPQGPTLVSINAEDNNCRGVLGEGPDIEGSYCRTQVWDGVATAKYGTFLFHRYLHTDDLIPTMGLGERRTITVDSDQFPGIDCVVTHPAGFVSYSSIWSVTIDLEGQVEGEWIENEAGELELEVECKHPNDRVSMTVECQILQ